MPKNPVIIGFDKASKDGDWCTECEMEITPDGRVIIHDIRQWRRTVDGELSGYSGQLISRVPSANLDADAIRHHLRQHRAASTRTNGDSI